MFSKKTAKCSFATKTLLSCWKIENENANKDRFSFGFGAFFFQIESSFVLKCQRFVILIHPFFLIQNLHTNRYMYFNASRYSNKRFSIFKRIKTRYFVFFEKSIFSPFCYYQAHTHDPQLVYHFQHATDDLKVPIRNIAWFTP